MSQDHDEKQFFDNKLPNRTYVSKRIYGKNPDGSERKVRGVSWVFDSAEFKEYIKEKKHVALYTSPSERQEVLAWVDEDTRGFSVRIQRFTKETGTPHKNTSFSFHSGALKKFVEFIQSLEFLDLSKEHNFRLEDTELQHARTIVEKYGSDPEISSLLVNSMTKKDIVATAYRKRQIEIFENLLHDEEFFNQKKSELSSQRNEDVWQAFFERNPWIFGYGLNFIFNTPLDQRKLEQTIKGSDVTGPGKRVDGLLKTRGFLSSLALVEIKTHKTDLLKQSKSGYRPGVWQPSEELIGGISQSQKNAQKTIENTAMSPLFSPTQKDGTPTGEVIHNYQPKAYLVAGMLSEFVSDGHINREKLSSFELFRKNNMSPEIITFDELYERAKYIVDAYDQQTS
jgi:antiviral defense system Shedu protein SduA